MVKRNTNSTAKGSDSALVLLLYLALSIFSALVFSVLYRRAITNGNSGIVWLVLCLISVVFYGIIAWSMVVTSSPDSDAAYFWLGIITLFSNGTALLLLIAKIFERN